jgi:molybdate transport system substrate-binding protein
MKKLICALLLLAVSAPLAAAQVTVYAAASLVDALNEIAANYKTSSGDTVKLSFAASSTLARQIEQGAPAGLFISADEDWMNYLAQRKLIIDDTRVDILGNQLVLIVPKEHAKHLDIAPGFDLVGLLGSSRLSVGDPASVPAGKYAQEALTKLGLWGVAEPRLLRAESVRVALLYVERGEAAAGIVYATDAAASKAVAVAGVFPENSHAPVVYPMAVLKDGDSAATRAFSRYLRGAEAQAVFKRFGFTPL